MHPRKKHPEETHDEGNPDTTFRCSKYTILNTLIIKQMFNIFFVQFIHITVVLTTEVASITGATY